MQRMRGLEWLSIAASIAGVRRPRRTCRARRGRLGAVAVPKQGSCEALSRSPRSRPRSRSRRRWRSPFPSGWTGPGAMPRVRPACRAADAASRSPAGPRRSRASARRAQARVLRGQPGRPGPGERRKRGVRPDGHGLAAPRSARRQGDPLRGRARLCARRRDRHRSMRPVEGLPPRARAPGRSSSTGAPAPSSSAALPATPPIAIESPFARRAVVAPLLGAHALHEMTGRPGTAGRPSVRADRVPRRGDRKRLPHFVPHAFGGLAGASLTFVGSPRAAVAGRDAFFAADLASSPPVWQTGSSSDAGPWAGSASPRCSTPGDSRRSVSSRRSCGSGGWREPLEVRILARLTTGNVAAKGLCERPGVAIGGEKRSAAVEATLGIPWLDPMSCPL